MDYELFAPDISDLDMSAKTLKKGVGDKSGRKIEPKTYIEWEADFEQRVEDGFFKQYDWLIFDSFTTWADSIMDRVMWHNGRLGKMPEQDDWAAQMTTIQNAWRVLVNLPLGVFCTGHVDVKQNDVTKRVYNHLMMTGKLRVRIPLLFSHLLVFSADADDKQKKRFLMQTSPDRENPNVRTSFKDLQFIEDVTIEDFTEPETYGLGAILSARAETPSRQSKPTKSAKGK
jgi:hypothetical protein